MSEAVAAADLERLRDSVTGTVLDPGAEAYDETRSIFNSMIDCRPAVIVRCAGDGDIRTALGFATERDLEVAVRGGGHSVAGSGVCEGGLVIDLRAMSEVTVDPGARLAIAQGGAAWGHFDAATQPHSLATTGGRVSTTGVAGLTLGGGSGWIERKMGLACDNLAAVELITASGEKLRASEEENEELFWALHGGGGNFGVVTSLELRLRPLPEFSLGFLFWSAERGREVVSAYRDMAAQAPADLGGGVLYLTGFEADFVPAHLQGALACAVLATWTGPEAGLRETIRPLLDLEPEGELITPIPYAEMQCMIDDPPGYRNYWSAEHLDELPDAAIEKFCALGEELIVPSPTQHIIFPWGEQVAARAGDFPVPNREARWVVHPLTMWEDPADDERAIAWTRELGAEMRRWAVGGAYLNFTGDEGEERVIEGYGGREVYERLARIKAEHDPGNVFHLNHNIKPLVAA
jgi:FAD/FMN-containing dehydrogenase